MDAGVTEDAIELQITEISQLFHSLDPFPFREKDLDKEAEDFIVSWARELPVDRPLRIVVHLPEEQASSPEARELGPALTRYFDYRAGAIDLDLNELFRVGRRALAIGVTVLSFSVIAGQTAAAHLSPRPIGRVVEESLLIFGWVANWRPIEIFLYEWWPIVRRRNLYRRLAAAQVELRPFNESPDEPSVVQPGSVDAAGAEDVRRFGAGKWFPCPALVLGGHPRHFPVFSGQ